MTTQRARSDYARAVQAAYTMRAMFSTDDFAFDPFLPISVLPNLRVCKYSTFVELFNADPLTYPELLSEDAFTLPINGGYIICYNDSPYITPTRLRFSLAHELGHYMLQHRRGVEAEEREADCFARNLLAPRQIALYHDIGFEDYQTVFGVSASVVRVCMDKRREDECLSVDLYPLEIILPDR